MAKNKQPSQNKAMAIGDYVLPRRAFPDLEKVFANFTQPDFKQAQNRQRFRRINETLLKLIKNTPTPCFLLPAVIDFIDRVNTAKLLHDTYHFSLFEFWLNQFSELNDQENYLIRAKIAGKYIPREDYQAFFPIGMNKVFNGTHFVAAHLSPDVDTMIASFWGWMDAFAARVGSSLHLWSLPGGPPEAPASETLKDFFGQSLFSHLPHLSGSLTLGAMDLITQKGFLKRQGNTSISTLDINPDNRAVILVNEEGHYLGEWHRSDIDPIRQIIIRFKSCLRWFETNLHVNLISFFSKPSVHRKEIPALLAIIFDVSIKDCEPVKEFTDKQREDLDAFYRLVLEMPKGINSTFRELTQTLIKFSVNQLDLFQKELQTLPESDLFEQDGLLREDRPAIFHALEKLIYNLDNAIRYARDYAERLDVAINIKTKVLGIPPLYITMRSEVEEIRIKMQNREYLTIVIPEKSDKLFPVGIVWNQALQQSPLGTVSFRDFCNQEEVRMASYLAPISVIDHHKTALKTNSPPMAVISDAQSCNVLIAEQMFQLNDRYGTGGMSLEILKEEVRRLSQEPATRTTIRAQQRTFQKLSASASMQKYFIHPEREIAEYLCFLLAILDDTDLLTKVSKRDIDCIIQLLNRTKSLIAQQELEIIDLDAIPHDKNFAKSAAKQILQNPEMYSLYRKIYESKEQDVERYLTAAIQNQSFDNLFADTKEQNGCCRVGQTKLFSINIPAFSQAAPNLLNYWNQTATKVHERHSEIDLHLHMISTVTSAEEVYRNQVGHYKHQDELWFWAPFESKAYDHLSSFLTAFQAAHRFGKECSLEFLSSSSDELRLIFNQNMAEIPEISSKRDLDLPIVILRFRAGFLNSRKAMITPYLPKLPS